ncbi:multiple epidermal growth factor-like domains protein 6 [Biomphalaria glabrata]|uniref:Multiple epidermal growth factor-like domains protein 6 n=1 Tax=Biomphalaria glabrata TaxID=6526 RepID=A0A9W3AC98_BIOGL|nr:multiple epidermal growth factor-like domains protein 6 [Biomphalaria glabrata]
MRLVAVIQVSFLCTCLQACTKSKWGENCERNCNGRCFNRSCDAITGLCDQGCLGYTGPPKCLGNCKLGYYGLNCATRCPENCKEDVCDPNSGRCFLCAFGYKMSPVSNLCDTECDSGTWGLMCNSTCSEECQGDCYPANGSCLSPVCPHGKWGDNCHKTCSRRCHNRTCNSVTGVCECRSAFCHEKAESLPPTSWVTLFKQSLQLLHFYALLAAVAVVCVYVWLLGKREVRDFSIIKLKICRLRPKETRSENITAKSSENTTTSRPVYFSSVATEHSSYTSIL